MRFQSRIVASVGLMLVSVAAVSFAQDVKTDDDISPVLPVANPCPRFSAGSVVHNPPALFSSNGVLQVRFSYQHRFDSDGTELLCFMTPGGLEDPTLHVKPGDHLIITVTNNTPSTPAFMPPLNPPNCGNPQPTRSSINIHYHGTNTSPACHQDNVIKTVINSGETFQYNLAFPLDEPSGLYWYHPHIHMLAEYETQAGATGAIIVEGIERQQPAVSGLRQRVFVVRDQLVPGNPAPIGNIPSFDLTLNYIPITSPTDPNSNIFVPPLLRMQPGTREFWRVANSAADTILDIQYVFDGVPQTMHLVAVDGVPLNSQDSTGPGSLIDVTHFTLPNASRVEFIVSAPPSSVQLAQLITMGIASVASGIYNDPRRPLLTVQLTVGNEDDNGQGNMVGTFSAVSTTQKRFAGLGSAPVAVKRTVFFNENVNENPPQFFTCKGSRSTYSIPMLRPTSWPRKERWKSGPSRTVRSKITHFTSIRFTSWWNRRTTSNSTAPTRRLPSTASTWIRSKFHSGTRTLTMHSPASRSASISAGMTLAISSFIATFSATRTWA